VKSSGSNASTATKRATKLSLPIEKAQGEEVALGQEVVDRLKSWCYV